MGIAELHLWDRQHGVFVFDLVLMFAVPLHTIAEVRAATFARATEVLEVIEASGYETTESAVTIKSPPRGFAESRMRIEAAER